MSTNRHFTQKFADSIVAVLGCFDRVIFKGHLPFGGDGYLNVWVDRVLEIRRVAVGTPVARRPPHRSVHAAFPHTALTSGAWRKSADSGEDARSAAQEPVMPIKAKCGSCGASVKVADELAGNIARCPKCNAAFAVPGADPRLTSQPSSNLNSSGSGRRQPVATAMTARGQIGGGPANQGWESKVLWIVLSIVGGVLLLSCLGVGGCIAMVGVGTRNLAKGLEQRPGQARQVANDFQAPQQQEMRRILSVPLANLLDEYFTNEVAADLKYKGKWLQVQGQVDSIDKTFVFHSIVVSLNSDGGGRSLFCEFPDRLASEVAQLRPGQTITVIGRWEGRRHLEDCEFAGRSRDSGNNPGAQVGEGNSPNFGNPTAAGANDGRRFWRFVPQHGGGYFRLLANGMWEEIGRDGRLMGTWQELGRTPEYVELYDQKRNYKTRLGAGKAWLASGRDSNQFGPSPEGNWEASAASNAAAIGRTKWLNSSYDTTIKRMPNGVWVEVDNKSGREKWELIEKSSSGEYIELYNASRKETIRLYAIRMEIVRNGKWEWLANGRWSGDQVASAQPSQPESPKSQSTKGNVTSSPPVLGDPVESAVDYRFHDLFEDDPISTDKKYQNKVVAIKGYLKVERAADGRYVAVFTIPVQSGDIIRGRNLRIDNMPVAYAYIHPTAVNDFGQDNLERTKIKGSIGPEWTVKGICRGIKRDPRAYNGYYVVMEDCVLVFDPKERAEADAKQMKEKEERQAQVLLKDAVRQLRGNQTASGVASLRRIVKEHPDTNAANDARTLLKQLGLKP